VLANAEPHKLAYPYTGTVLYKVQLWYVHVAFRKQERSKQMLKNVCRILMAVIQYKNHAGR